MTGTAGGTACPQLNGTGLGRMAEVCSYIV